MAILGIHHGSAILLGVLVCPISTATSFSCAAPHLVPVAVWKGDGTSKRQPHRGAAAVVADVVGRRGLSCAGRSSTWFSKRGRHSMMSKATTDISGGGDNDKEDDTNNTAVSDENAMKGRTTLCLVALLYGTLNVSLRLIYQLPEPPTASALSAARGMLACVGFLPLLLVPHQPADRPDDTTSSPTTTTSTTGMTSLLVAGLELAFWNFLAQGLLNIGLLSTTSARASFLTQASVVFTPVLSRIFGQRVPSNVWAACGLALVGLTVLSSAASTGGAGTAAAAAAAAATGGGSLSSLVHFGTGDWLVLGGALSWSMYLFRISSIGAKFNEINLQFVKTSLLAVLYVIWFLASVVMNGNTAITQPAPFGWLMNGAAFLVLLYSAVGPGTVADVLQQQGQKEVSASEANVILSLEPVFTALCAWLVLGELTTMQEAVGGAIILSAALVATRS